MKFLADENVERAIVALLRSEGHDVLYVAEQVTGIDDDAVLAEANAEDRILITNDKDFGELVFLSGRATAGILLLRLGRERTADKLVSLRRLFAQHTDSLRDHFTVVGVNRIRRRPLRRR